MRTLWSFNEVVEVLGGPARVARLAGGNNVAAVGVWRRRNQFPTKYYFVMRAALEDLGFQAPIELWGFYTAERESA
ncbi:hypothetical protein [Bradyrhizobium neotropicale]|uniref:hypothetical protein n=1 Tax=Bradyrhizobium neotropicale TaxID=1497615 RepID=UPI001AD64BB2|nr:hypothetical protein [Bradyrhizobium neotropicale]MBO4221996.1 hypothetical protein [Bradyrhizobium neotropicale]